MATPAPSSSATRLLLVVTDVQQTLDATRTVTGETITFAVNPDDPDGYNASWFSGAPVMAFQVDITNPVMFGQFDVGDALPLDAVLTLVLTAITPNTGPAAGGTAVTIAGKGFRPGMYVTIGGTAATGIAVTNGGELTCTTPAGAAGAADVVVSFNADMSNPTTLAGGFTYV